MSASTSVAAQLDRSRRDLLDLTLRNPLLNFRPSKTRGLTITGEISREIFRIIARDERLMYFLPAGSRDADKSLEEGIPRALLASIAEHEDPSSEPAAHHVDNRLQTPYSATQLELRLKNTFRTAHTSIEEQGVNILFLALGTLNWYESESSEMRRMAPLILVPVELSRTSIRAHYRIGYTNEEIGANLSLEAKLKADFDIRLPELPDVEDLDVSDYFQRVRLAISRKERWTVDPNAIFLGFFSFSKLLIYKDLDPASWPEDTPPSDHPVIEALLSPDGFRNDAPDDIEEAGLDPLLTAPDAHQILDSDSSQTLAVIDAMKGRNLVIQGPPGTGKSQTITNLIAEAIAQDKKVLFVAEKMAALEVVKRRLDSVHIGDACLELHSHTANKKAVVDELRRTLHLGKPQLKDVTEDRLLMDRRRKRLDEYSTAINTPIGQSGFTPHEVIGRLARFEELDPGTEWPLLSGGVMASCGRREFLMFRESVAAFQESVGTIGKPREHIFWESTRTSFLPTERLRILAALRNAVDAIGKLRDSVLTLQEAVRWIDSEPDLEKVARLIRTVSRATGKPDLGDVDHQHPDWRLRHDDIEEIARDVLEFSELHSRYESILIPEAWDQNVLSYRRPLMEYGGKWWRFLSGQYRAARNGLYGLCRSETPSEGAAQVKIVEAILREQRLRRRFEGSRLLSRLFPRLRMDRNPAKNRQLNEVMNWFLVLHREIAGEAVDERVHELLDLDLDRVKLNHLAESCRRDAERLSGALEAVAGILKLNTSRTLTGTGLTDRRFSDLEIWLDTARNQLNSLHEIVRFNNSEKRLAESGLQEMIDTAVTWQHAGNHLVDLFERSWLVALIETALQERPVLSEFDGRTHQKFIEEFCKLDTDFFQHNRALVAQAHWERLPRHHGGGQLGVLKREFEKKRRHLPLRKLMAKAGNAIQQVKPIFMMSPLSVAKFIPPESVRFDLVIFDEASQVKPVEAMGAIRRGRHSIVVGDSKQLPPTRFFERIVEGAEDEDQFATSDIESILGLFAAQGALERMLRWHYRSRHESLITVSNHEFYENRLVIFPSPDAGRKEVGLQFRCDPATYYERGARRRFNRGEARAVAEAVIEHAQTQPDLTLGVAAFSIAQARRVEDELEILRRRDPAHESFFAKHPDEPFFVKNLENVQGDERDVILISIGYGKTEDGRLPMNFGPLNQDGGERRLNVLITRARRRCVVYSNFNADDLDLRRTKARGVQALQTFLKYAATGILEVPRPSGGEADSPFEEAVSARLKERGHTVDHQIGSSGFFVDLGIIDPARPGRYLLGIECDGATYHSARSARDRDRLRQQVLEGLGWTIHRIWSTDWFHHPDREMEKVEEAIRQAKQDESFSERTPKRSGSRAAPISRVEVPETAEVAEPYQVATPEFRLWGEELHEVGSEDLMSWILQVVQVESPVHLYEVARRIATTAGVKRVGSRIRNRIQTAADAAARSGKIYRIGNFLWRGDHKQVPLRRRDHLPPAMRHIDLISPQELGAALLQAVRASHGIDEAGAINEAARLFGFKRVGPSIRSSFKTILGGLVESGILTHERQHLHPGSNEIPIPGGDGR